MKIKSAFIIDQPREVLADMEQDVNLDNDPEYAKWSNSVSEFSEWAKDINDNFSKVFGANAKETGEVAPF